MIMVDKRGSLAGDPIHYMIATVSRIISLWVQLVNHVSPVLRNTRHSPVAAPFMQSSPARASIENVLSCDHLRRKRRPSFHSSLGWSCSCIVHAEIVLNYISIPNHVFLGDWCLWLPVFAVLERSAREWEFSRTIHLTDLVWIWASHKYLGLVLILLFIFFDFDNDWTPSLICVSRSICSSGRQFVTQGNLCRRDIVRTHRVSCHALIEVAHDMVRYIPVLVTDVSRGTVQWVGCSSSSAIFTVGYAVLFDFPYVSFLTISFGVKFDFFSFLMRLQSVIHCAFLVDQYYSSQVVSEGLSMSWVGSSSERHTYTYELPVKTRLWILIQP